MRGGLTILLATLSCAFATQPAIAAQVLDPSSSVLVIFGGDTIRAEVAQTPQELEQGLMFREAVPDGTGMLFVFSRAEVQRIWMKNTFVPLDVAFLDADFRVINIEPLEPEDLTTKSSSGPALFALEVRQGWFEERGIRPGDRADIVFGRR